MKGNRDCQKKCVAYFCMEYALESHARLYAGGLGILAGDYLKTAKDQGYPVIGVGILWKQGYTTQSVADDGRVVDSYCNCKSKYEFMEDTGVVVSVKIKDEDVKCKIWKVETFSNSTLYLLDTDIPENGESELKWTTGQLYGGFEEQRIAQEIVLGIGGVRALRKLGIEPDVYHFNEGHAVFAGFELIRERLEAGEEFEKAFEDAKKSIVFTTHTPIKQGNESHPLEMLMYMGANNGLESKELQAIGGNPFSMTVAGLRLSKISNGVSRLHAHTANEMWKDIEGRSEIIQVTNGIHVPTWVDGNIMKSIDDEQELQSVHARNKNELMEYIFEKTRCRFSEEILTVGFARRAAPYKRADLLLQREEVLSGLFDQGRLQIVFSGKSHPLDDEGKQIVKRIYEFCSRHPQNSVFIQDYDMETGMKMTRGCDVWLNTPQKPYEASGTSGMKAAMNGVLNLSVLDGWWYEACIDGENGWQFGDGKVFENREEQDERDLEALIDVMVKKVVPTYYEDRKKWAEMMKSSIQTTKEYFDMKRTIREYYNNMYCDFEV